MKAKALAAVLIGLVLSAGAGAAGAEEGMWTFDAVPVAALRQSLGVSLDRAGLDHLRLASVRLSSGCSAALVSRNGLALTNQHCLLACAEALSATGRDVMADGFLTDSRSEERMCPGLEAEVLVGIDDATEPIFHASRGKIGADFVQAREGEISRLERDACRRDQGLTCQVIGFFGGGQFKLYRFRRHDDVRLVFAPEFAVSFFGGDADNFSFPRFDFDSAFVRLYEAGRPAKTPASLAWARSPPVAGEAVFTSGNPGLTERSATVAELVTERDVLAPAEMAARVALIRRLDAFAAGGEENRRLAAAAEFEAENALKLIRGRAEVLSDPRFLADRQADEQALRAKLASRPRVAAAIGDPWGVIDAAQAARASEEPLWRALDSTGGSQLCAWARLIVRGAAERAKPDASRLPEFREARLAQASKALLDDRPVSPGLEATLLAAWLDRVSRTLGQRPELLAKLLGGASPDVLAGRLVGGSRLADPAVRRALWDGGAAAVEASDDPLIVFERRADPVARAARRDYEDDVLGPAQEAHEAVARARLALGESDLYPDATFSLRLSGGRVDGWTDGAARIAPFTTLGGLYGREGAATPLPARWRAARADLDPATILDFVTTNDIIGGNSGSPVVDAKGRLVGVAFDGNKASIAGDYAYDAARDRTVAVSTAAIDAVLARVYHRSALIAELDERR